MSESSGPPINIWERLKKLTGDRKKVVDRLKRVNESISSRSKKLNDIGEKYSKITFALDKLKDEMSEEQIQMSIKLLESLSKNVAKLTDEIGDLSQPNIILFNELEEIEAEIAALTSIINADQNIDKADRKDPKEN